MAALRQAEVADARGIARVHVQAWLTTYRGLMPDALLDRLSIENRQLRWEDALRRPNRTGTVVVEEGSEIVGFASYGPEVGNDRKYRGELYALYVLEPFQRHGLGRQLVRAAAQGLLERHLPDMLLWVLTTNPARKFYEQLGGQYLRERTVEFDGAPLQEAAYGWPDLSALTGPEPTHG